MVAGGSGDVPMVEGEEVIQKGDNAGQRWGLAEGGGHQVFVVDAGQQGTPGTLATVRLWRKEKQVCRKSFFYFTVDNPIRRLALTVAESPYFDQFILFCILLNSLLLVCYQYRGSPNPQDNSANKIISVIADDILTWIFTAECLLKILALGLFWDQATYLRDSWNILDFVVVVSGAVEKLGIGGGGLGFLRLFRVLRPLRSLNRVPEMKKLVNSSISAVPRLSNVAIMGAFLYTIFAIIGMTFFRGVFYRRCRGEENPALDPALGCWAWSFAESAGRMCGGDYMCEVGEFCKGHEQDMDDTLRPVYNINGTIYKVIADTGYSWCANAEPAKWSMIDGEVMGFPETDHVHFDHIGGAFLLIFQCMTMEGWTDLMYYVQDAFGKPLAWTYFIIMVIVTSFLLLNVALAVVDEALESFEEDEEVEEDEGENEETQEGANLLPTFNSDHSLEAQQELCMDCATVRVANRITQNKNFQDMILIVIVANVIVMMLETYPPNLGVETPKQILEQVFLVVFCAEMVLELLARGPKGYWTNPFTAFDGFVVILAVIGKIFPIMNLSMLRTFRLFRVLMKIAKKQPALGVLLKAMWGTAKALKYWSVLFLLVLYICTLMMMTFFNNRFHFEEPNVPPEAFAKTNSMEVDGNWVPWCPNTEGLVWNERQDCIPRANFDTFTWGFVTVFQIMTGENWNTIMYSGMRGGGWAFAVLFVGLILFGQTLFLSLFLSMLISSYSDIQDGLEAKLKEKQMSRQMSRKISVEAAASWSASADDIPDMHLVPPTKMSEEDDLRDVDGKTAVQPLDPKEAEAEDSPETLPGQLPESSPQTRVSQTSAEKANTAKYGDEDDDLAFANAAQIPSKRPWPHGYSWFILHERNPVRQFANRVLTAEVSGVNIFDNAILVCILISTIGMIYDHPSADRNDSTWQAVSAAQKVFAVIFICEMLVKLLAFPLIWGDKAYLRDAWNILDATVVSVSVLDFLSIKGPGFLKVLRILRALRPLRVINRNENLKLVVRTIFKSMIELGWLLVVMLLFTLIFSLVGVSELRGHFYQCSLDSKEVTFLRTANGTGSYELYDSFVTPLCFGADLGAGSVPGGSWDSTGVVWTGSCASDSAAQWQRGSIDTPICVAQCNPDVESHDIVGDLCPRRYANPTELPNNCGEEGMGMWTNADEKVGYDYVLSQQRMYIVPCGGTTPQSVANGESPPRADVSCRNKFCPNVDSDVVESCKSECEIHPDFCVLACGADGDQATCDSCRSECEAACQCPDFCTPYVKDAALCYEQGGIWVSTVSQNFNNVANAMMTLFEISTTEGWVDVMYAASDATGPYMQPLRDTSMYFWVPFFVVWIFLSFMFLVNLAVGIIADKFMDMQESDQGVMLTMWQRKWKKTRTTLYSRHQIYDMENLQLLPSARRAVYDFVGCDRENATFEKFIMGCIVANTILMGAGMFPQPFAWFELFQKVCNTFFAVVFTVEAILKLYTLRWLYFRNNWNVFDFICVVSTLGGIVVSEASSIDIRTITSVIRIFRIARLFRLLRFMKELNKIFMALILSLPGLVNVILVLLLLLILFSILGVQLFGTVKQGDTLNQHGNFKDFTYAFTTLFRASTGEAWNEIMHDLAKTESDFFRQPDASWCTPADLYDLDDYFNTLRDKCLIERPNTCVQQIGTWNVLPYLYWVGYTLLIGLVVLNLLITVILAGYAEGKRSGEEEHDIEICKALWGSKYDPDHRMTIPFKNVIAFINEAVLQVIGEDTVPLQLPEDLPMRIPLKLAKAFDLKVPPSGQCNVHFRLAVRQVLRIAAVAEGGVQLVEDLDRTDNMISAKERKHLQQLEQKGGLVEVISQDLARNLAADKLQSLFRVWKARRERKLALKQAQGDHVRFAQRDPAGHRKDRSGHLHGAAHDGATVISPPIAG
mmetsp:Transcript_35025/g.89980  ORF Transcript_35025/g.89980 Transcript_35025/m.89980 type:complete len:1901 (+) Transcript_35025:285-5987(+)